MYQSEKILGEFIKECRGRVSPQTCGILANKRRRVKGLRREELAFLCGISTTWITWIEQGRSQSMSPLTLDSICKTLQLNEAERAYVFKLANLYDSYLLKNNMIKPSTNKFEYATEILNQLNCPGFVTNRQLDVLSINIKAKKIFSTWLKGKFRHENNILVHTFLNPIFKESIDSWEDLATKIVANLRFNTPHLMYDKQFQQLIHRLEMKSSEFVDFWNQFSVSKNDIGRISLNNRPDHFYTHKAFCDESDDNLHINVLIE